MTQEIKSPSIIVKNLLVKQNEEHVAYFQNFHNGINVLYGQNGGGKTSIIQLLVYVLGYDVNKWVNEALLCEYVYAEVELNGQTVTLRRKINDKVKQSLYISFDDLAISLNKSIDGWLEYPYSISKNKESFSQKIFNILDIPENRVDGDVNMTLHQLLRFMYKKQSDSATYILNYEEWDSALKREAIQDYLLGFYDDDLYEAKINLKKYEKELIKFGNEIKSIRTILTSADIDFENNTLEEFIENIDEENISIYEEIKTIKEKELSNYTEQNETIGKLANENLSIKNDLIKTSDDLALMKMDIEDNAYFIAELIDKISSIKDSIKLKKLSTNLIDFEMCPSCFTKIEKTKKDNCSLCNAENPSELIELNLLKMKNELELQLVESNNISAMKYEKIIELENTQIIQESYLEDSTKKLNIVMNSIDMTREDALFKLFNQIGVNKEKIETFQKLDKLSKKIGELVIDRDKAQINASACIETIETRLQIIQSRKDIVSDSIHSKMRVLLKEDIAEKDDFSNVEKVFFDFSKNEISINSKTVFSESSMYLINNLLHFSIFLTSLEKDFLRVPKLLILDGIENGGMSEQRSKNFQNILKKHTEHIEYQYQIFITTRSISDSLNTSDFMLGDELTENNKSLKLVAAQ